MSKSASVPIASFVLAILLSLVAGRYPSAIGARSPGQATGGECKTDIKNVKAEIKAKDWDPTAPGQGSLELSGSFETKFNTESWSGADLLSLRITLTVMDSLTNETKTGEALGTAKKTEHTASKTSTDDDDVKNEDFKIGKGKVDLSDGAGVDAAILDAAKKLALAGGLSQGTSSPTAESVDKMKNSLKSEVGVFLAIHMGGLLHDHVTPCPKRWHGDAKLAINKKGNADKTDLSKVDNEPGGDEPFPPGK